MKTLLITFLLFSVKGYSQNEYELIFYPLLVQDSLLDTYDSIEVTSITQTYFVHGKGYGFAMKVIYPVDTIKVNDNIRELKSRTYHENDSITFFHNEKRWFCMKQKKEPYSLDSAFSIKINKDGLIHSIRSKRLTGYFTYSKNNVESIIFDFSRKVVDELGENTAGKVIYEYDDQGRIKTIITKAYHTSGSKDYFVVKYYKH